MSRWWRAEDTSIDHPKLLLLSDAMHRAWYTLMCVASANDGELPSVEHIAARLRIKPGHVAAWITHLVSAGLFDNDGGTFRPHNWNKRQYKTDVTDSTNAERQKRYRNKRRNGSNGDSNGVTDKRPETEQIQITEQSRAESRDPLKIRTGDFQRAIVDAFAAANSPNLPETSRAGLWLSQGFQEDICLAVIADIVRKKPSITTLNYFDNAIREAHAAKAPPRAAVISKPEETNWDAICISFKKTRVWSKHAPGNSPDSDSCLCPPEILERYGIKVFSGSNLDPPAPILRAM